MSSEAPRGARALVTKELFFSLYFPAVALSLGQGLAAPALPVYAKSFDISFGTASLVVIVHGFGSLAATLPTGYLVDRIGRRPLLLAGPLLTAISAILTAFATSFPELLVYRFINGCAAQIWLQSRLTMIADTGGDRERGRMITWMLSLQRAGNLFSPALGGVMASVWDIRAPFIFHGILAAVAIVPSFSSVAETAPGRARRRGRHGVEEESVEEQGGSDLRFIAREMMRPHMLAFLVAEFLANIARGINRGGILLLYATYVYGVGAATLGGLATLNAIVSIPIGFSAGYLMDRFGRKTTIVPGFALIAVAMAVMALVAWAQWPFLVFVAAYVFLHASQSLTGGNMQVLASDLAPSRARGRFFAIWRIFGEGGTAFSPVWFAVLAESIAYSASFGVFGVASFGCSMIIAFLVRDVVGDERRAARVAAGSGS